MKHFAILIGLIIVLFTCQAQQVGNAQIIATQKLSEDLIADSSQIEIVQVEPIQIEDVHLQAAEYHLDLLTRHNEPIKHFGVISDTTIISYNPNDYQYNLIIIPKGKVIGGGKTYYINGEAWTVSSYGVHRGHSTSVLECEDDIVFEHTFSNFDELISYLPKIMKKLNKEHNELFEYKFYITVIGLKVTYALNAKKDYVYETNYYTSNYSSTTKREVESIINYISLRIKEEYLGIKWQPLNSRQYDKKGNEIYIDKNGNKVIWNRKKHNFEFVETNKHFDINDL